MRFALLIFVTILLSMGASWLIWRDRLTPTTVTKHSSSPPTPLQRQYGSRISPELAAALERKLPATFDTSGGFDAVTRRLRDASGVRILVNWRSLERYGRVNEQTPINIAVGGMTLQQALTRILASVQSTEPLAALANDDALFIDAAPELEWTTMTRVYDVRDLLPRSTPSPIGNTPVAAATIIADVEKNIAPGTWRPQNARNGPRRPGALQHVSGQLVVTHTAESQYDVVEYLNHLRVARGRWDFAQRAGILTAASIGALCLVAAVRRLLQRRAARRAGLCRQCGYDLRASTDRCPECGAAIRDLPRRAVAA